MSNRSAADSPVPVDVIGGEEFRQNSSSDVQDMLRTNVPSFDVNTQPISDVATIVRPANMRGLSPDNVLVLVNVVTVALLSLSWVVVFLMVHRVLISRQFHHLL